MEPQYPSRRARGSERRASAAAQMLLRFGPPTAVGVALRLHQLGAQVLGGDELHAVRAALRGGFGSILTTFQVADNSIPLTALYRAALDAGLPLSDATLRAPVLAAGIALLLLAPPLLVRRLGGGAATCFAWLLALSPLLVLYSRIVRSYMPATLLACGALLAFERWLSTRGRAAAAAYVGLAALAVWFHLLAAPCVLAPLAFAAGLRALGRERAPAGAVLAALAGALGLAIAALLLPGADSLLQSLGSRRQEHALGPGGLLDLARLEAGNAHAPLALLFLAVAARGLAHLLRTQPRFGACTAFTVSAQLAAIWLVAPYQSQQPIVFQRYALFVLPLVLGWAAVGLAAPWPFERRARGAACGRGMGARARAAQLGLAALFVTVLAGSGPLARDAFLRGSFAHHNDLIAFHRPPGRIPAAQIPAFYRELAASPAHGAVLEYPWIAWWDLARSLPAYQELHRRPVRVVPRSGDLVEPRLRLRSVVAPDPAAMLASDARWLVVHLDIGTEEEGVRGGAALLDRAATAPYRERFWPPLRTAGHAMAAQLRALWGEPDRADAQLEVWDLERLRAGLGP